MAHQRNKKVHVEGSMHCSSNQSPVVLCYPKLDPIVGQRIVLYPPLAFQGVSARTARRNDGAPRCGCYFSLLRAAKSYLGIPTSLVDDVLIFGETISLNAATSSGTG